MNKITVINAKAEEIFKQGNIIRKKSAPDIIYLVGQALQGNFVWLTTLSTGYVFQGSSQTGSDYELVHSVILETIR